MKTMDRLNRVEQHCAAWAPKLTDLTLLLYRPCKKSTRLLRQDSEIAAEVAGARQVSRDKGRPLVYSDGVMKRDGSAKMPVGTVRP